MKITGIYRIQSIIKSERIYIGSTIDMNKRWSDHKSELNKNKHHSRKLQNHFNKYGESDLVFIIVELCFPEFLTAREQYYIDKLKPWFNIALIAGSNLGCHWELSDDFKRKNSENKKGEKNHNYGKHLSEETKQKLREAHKGQISGAKGKKWSKESRKKLSELCKGRHHSDETKRKMSLASKGKPKSEQHKQNIKKNWKGKLNYFIN